MRAVPHTLTPLPRGEGLVASFSPWEKVTRKGG